MKIKDLTVDYIMSLDGSELGSVKWDVRDSVGCSRKTLKKISLRPITTDRQAKELSGIRRALAHQEAMHEACMCREDELYGPGVLSTYDHGQSF